MEGRKVKKAQLYIQLSRHKDCGHVFHSRCTYSTSNECMYRSGHHLVHLITTHFEVETSSGDYCKWPSDISAIRSSLSCLRYLRVTWSHSRSGKPLGVEFTLCHCIWVKSITAICQLPYTHSYLQKRGGEADVINVPQTKTIFSKALLVKSTLHHMVISAFDSSADKAHTTKSLPQQSPTVLYVTPLSLSCLSCLSALSLLITAEMPQNIYKQETFLDRGKENVEPSPTHWQTAAVVGPQVQKQSCLPLTSCLMSFSVCLKVESTKHQFTVCNVQKISREQL